MTADINLRIKLHEEEIRAASKAAGEATKALRAAARKSLVGAEFEAADAAFWAAFEVVREVGSREPYFIDYN